MKLKLVLSFIFITLMVLYYTSVFAVDELYLCGVVEKVIPQTGKISIDVKSESCNGLHVFKLPGSNSGESFQVGNRKCFFINSNECKAGYIYQITKTDRG